MLSHYTTNGCHIPSVPHTLAVVASVIPVDLLCAVSICQVPEHCAVVVREVECARFAQRKRPFDVGAPSVHFGLHSTQPAQQLPPRTQAVRSTLRGEGTSESTRP
uniref:Uncharacterized protein n=1 Tax=Cacopsylla melanoneura TaxID=428564 RepID=A0A8D8W788_9HEMI